MEKFDLTKNEISIIRGELNLMKEEKKKMKKIDLKDLENIKEWKYTSDYNGRISYLIVDYKNKTISNDFYEYNGGQRLVKDLVQLKEIKRLTNYFINQGYEEVK